MNTIPAGAELTGVDYDRQAKRDIRWRAIYRVRTDKGLQYLYAELPLTVDIFDPKSNRAEAMAYAATLVTK